VTTLRSYSHAARFDTLLSSKYSTETVKFYTLYVKSFETLKRWTASRSYLRIVPGAVTGSKLSLVVCKRR